MSGGQFSPFFSSSCQFVSLGPARGEWKPHIGKWWGGRQNPKIGSRDAIGAASRMMGSGGHPPVFLGGDVEGCNWWDSPVDLLGFATRFYFEVCFPASARCFAVESIAGNNCLILSARTGIQAGRADQARNGQGALRFGWCSFEGPCDFGGADIYCSNSSPPIQTRGHQRRETARQLEIVSAHCRAVPLTRGSTRMSPPLSSPNHAGRTGEARVVPGKIGGCPRTP